MCNFIVTGTTDNIYFFVYLYLFKVFISLSLLKQSIFRINCLILFILKSLDVFDIKGFTFQPFVPFIPFGVIVFLDKFQLFIWLVNFSSRTIEHRINDFQR